MLNGLKRTKHTTMKKIMMIAVTSRMKLRIRKIRNFLVLRLVQNILDIFKFIVRFFNFS